MPARRKAALGGSAPSGRRTGAAGPGSRPLVCARSACLVRGRRRPAAAAPGEAVRLARAQRAAAAAHDGIRTRTAAHCGRSDAQPLSRSLSSPVPRALLPGLGAGAAARQPRSPAVGSLHGVRRILHRHGADLVPRARLAAGPGQVLSCRSAHPAGAQHRRAETHPPAFFPGACADRGVRRPLAVPEHRRADVSVVGGRGARLRRRDRRPRVGSSAQIPDPSRPSDPRSIRELSAGRRASQKAGRLGPNVSVLRARLGRVAALETERGPIVDARRHPAIRLDDLAWSSAITHPSR